MPDYRKKPIRIMWGPAYDRALDLPYGLDLATSYELEREGSEHIVRGDRSEDSWLLGNDCYLDGLARWIPRENGITPEGVRISGWDGADGWREFVLWARLKKKCRVYLDGTNLIQNASFEQGSAWWTNGAPRVYATDATKARTGSGYLELVSDANANVFQKATAPGGNDMQYPCAEGDVILAQAWSHRIGGIGTQQIRVQLLDATDTQTRLLNSPSVASDTYAMNELLVTVAAGEVSYKVFLRHNTGAGAGSRFDDVFVGNGVYRECYLVAPMLERPELEPDYTRRVAVSFRSCDGLPIEGY